jgi:cell wall-associated NlpC family hydrolase
VALTTEQIYAVARQAGFTHDQAITFTAIALAESGGDPSANAAGSEDSRGLWQINVSPGVRTNRWGDLYDPMVNARAAYEVANGGTNIRPWSVTHASNAGTARDYRRYLAEAQEAAAHVDAGGMSAADSPTGEPVTGDDGGRAAEDFVQAALAQVGDAYVYGHEVGLDDLNPTTFDCSELVQWAAHRAGVELQDGSYNQYLELRGEGAEITVDQALHTRGALLFWFSEPPTPGGGRPSGAHVAISLGDGTVVEAADEEDGVEISPAGDRFNYAATIPQLDTAAPEAAAAATVLPPAPLPDPTDSDGDGLTDEFEVLLGTDLHSMDTDQDGLSDLYETTVSHTDPLSTDTDQDATSDATEVAQGTDAGYQRLSDAVVAAGFGGAATADTDHDGLSDLLEQQLGTDRDAADTDIDGVSDAMEYAMGSDPTSIDTDRDGITDGAEFDMGTLGPALPPATAAGLPDSSMLPDPAVAGGHPDAFAGTSAEADHPYP